MAPPKTRSASSSNENSELEGKSNNEPTLSDILAEIRKLNVKQTSHDAELAELSVRFSELEATIKLNKDSSAAVKNDTLSDNESKVSEYIDKPKGSNNFPPRDPLIIPGLKSTWNPAKQIYLTYPILVLIGKIEAAGPLLIRKANIFNGCGSTGAN
ncbi:BgTH12-06288 [Blumeria graminis f. sp. triticale]|uniref:BgTH12-06288 n=1 Tax=Blumeria graminis f. sp. triticale TaxID=1689686 RepID=A0A9W4CXW1_BLUGR|nr:BgTH12-06288 [Blumeria graminis f. sp. triticale]